LQTVFAILTRSSVKEFGTERRCAKQNRATAFQ